jgi:hypothetical protein
MPIYEWINEQNEVVDHNHYSEPPDLPGTWRRIFSLSIGKVPGAGESPAGYGSNKPKGE